MLKQLLLIKKIKLISSLLITQLLKIVLKTKCLIKL